MQRSETAALNSFYQIMDEGDVFTFDLYCKGPDYDPNRDPLADRDQWSPAVANFFLNGVRRLEGRFDMGEDEALKDLFQ